MSGSSQSPIDLGVADSSEPLELAIDYRPSVDHGHDAGTTHNVSVLSGHSISYGGRTYGLDSYHFGSQSEHSIDGEFADAEIHLVHTHAAGDIAVPAVLVDASEQSASPLHFGEATAIESLLTRTCGPDAAGSSVDPCYELLVSSQGVVQRYHHSLKGIGAPTGVALDDRRAGNQASSLPEP